MPRLFANVQYGDWEGSAAADDADDRDIRELLATRGLLNHENEQIVAAELWIGENHGGRVEAPHVTVLVADQASLDAVAERLSNRTQLPVFRSIEAVLTLEEFIGLFKRFSVVLTKSGLDLTKREYTTTD